MEHEILVLTVLKLLTALLGVVFMSIAWRAYRKHGARSMLVLFIAVGVLTAAVLVEGFAFQVLGWDLDDAHIVEGAVTLIGFGVLVYSLYA